MRTRTSSPRRNAIAAIVVTAGLAVGASACGSDDVDDPADVDVDVDAPADTDMDDMGTVPMTVPMDTGTTVAGG